MTVRPRSRLVPLALVAAVVAGCSPTKADRHSSGPPSSTRPDVVSAIVNDVMLPATEDSFTAAVGAKDAVAELCAAPDDSSLAAARDAVADGWKSWRRTDSFDIGPAMKRRSSSVISYKVDVAKVDATLADAPPTDPETVRNRTGSSLRGYGAAWHLLTPDAAAFVSEPQRCAYLTAVVQVVVDETDVVHQAWVAGVDGAPPYVETADGEGADALEPTDVVDALVNMQLSQLEATGKLLAAAIEVEPGAPTGLPVAELFQLAAQVDGMRAVYEPGMLSALLDDDLAGRVTAALDAVSEHLAAESSTPTEADPTVELLTSTAELVEAARVVIATEVVSALDVTVSFSENDGDS